MKAPDKITISKYNITNTGDVVFAWLSKSPDCEPMRHPVEYVKTDTFIKKACDWLRQELVNFEDYSGMGEEFIGDFKKAMKVE